MAVLRAGGVESEAELPFAALHQLLRPVLGLAGRLPDPQAAALGSALGLGPPGDWASERDRFLVSVAVLSLLAEAAEDRPVLCLVDEAQGLDRDAAAALLAATGAGLPGEVVEGLVARTGGNPLALLELPGSLEPGQL